MVNYPTILNLPQKDINRQLYERVLKLQVKAKYHVLSLTINDGTDPISGATVTIGSDSVTTGADGKCKFELVDGTYDISVTKTGYADGSSSVTISGKNVAKTISLTVVDTISFTVNDGAAAISGATVVIGETSKTTGTSGGCTFPDMPYGTYSATVSAEGYTSKTESIVFDATHKSFTVSLTATGGTGTVTVTCQHEVDGQMSHTFDEFDGVKLSTHSTYDWNDEMGEAQYLVANGGTLDENGTVTLLVEDSSTDVPFGSYYLYAQGYLSASQELLQYSGTLTVDGNEEVTITLTAVDDSDPGGLIG